MVLLRFAPSPTGPLHLGGLRMALYNHLYANKLKGKWILRVEDTDVSRSVPGAVDGIQSALEWAGLSYDFGPGKDGPHAPYYQSERLDLYRQYAGKLIDSGHAYRCFCSEDQLQQTKKDLARSGSNSTYDKRCLRLTDEEVARKLRAGEKSVVRLNNSNLPVRSPATDLVFGHLKDAHASLATDPILLKSDMFPTYHLACVVDDHEMGITHVLRGEEWLPSLALHLDIYASLKISPPQFAHIPILLNPDGTKMSKRQGNVRVTDYIQRGWEPVAVLNWLALAGWGVQYESVSPENSSASGSRLVHQAPDSTTLMTLPQLIQEFDISAIARRSLSLDHGKLEYLNKHHLKRIWSSPEGLESLAKRVQDQIKTQFPKSEYTSNDYIKRVILLLEGRLVSIKDVPLHAKYLFEGPDLFSDEAKDYLAKTSKSDISGLSAAAAHLKAIPEPWDQAEFSKVLHTARSGTDMSTKPFMILLRYALTGTRDGPAVPDIMRILGRDRTLARLEKLATYDA